MRLCSRPTSTTSSRRRRRFRSCSSCEGSVLRAARLAVSDRGDRCRRRAPGRLAGQGRSRGPGRHPDEGADRRGIGRRPDDLPGLCARHAQDGGLRRCDPARSGQGPGRPPRPRRAAAGAVAARGTLLAHPGRGLGRRPALPRRLSLRLHRADPQPVPAHGHHPEGSDQPGRRPEGDPRQATPTSTPRSWAMRGSGPSGGRATSTTRSSTRPRSRGWPPPASQRLADMQLSDGGWGWFSGYRRVCLAAHHGPGRPRPATRPPERPGLAAEGMLERGVAWLTGYQAKQAQLLAQRRSARSSRSRRPPTISMPLCSWSWPTAACATTRMLGFLDRDRTHLSVYAKAMLRPGAGETRREGQAGDGAPEHRPVCRAGR